MWFYANSTPPHEKGKEAALRRMYQSINFIFSIKQPIEKNVY
jgi:hypothetical protein